MKAPCSARAGGWAFLETMPRRLASLLRSPTPACCLCFLPFACCLLAVGFCLLPFGFCLLPFAFSLLPLAFACWLLPVASCLQLSAVAFWLLAFASCFLPIGIYFFPFAYVSTASSLPLLLPAVRHCSGFILQDNGVHHAVF